MSWFKRELESSFKIALNGGIISEAKLTGWIREEDVEIGWRESSSPSIISISIALSSQYNIIPRNVASKQVWAVQTR